MEALDTRGEREKIEEEMTKVLKEMNIYPIENDVI